MEYLAEGTLKQWKDKQFFCFYVHEYSFNLSAIYIKLDKKFQN